MSDSTRLQDAASTPSWRTWLAAMRPVHWVKNILLVVPPIFGQAQLTPALVAHLCAGIVVCSLAASAGYLLNDVFDRGADRQHPTKRCRPVAAGLIDPAAAIVAALMLCVASLALSIAMFSPMVAGLIAAYLVATVSYSLFFKRLPIIDIVLLAGLYVWRLVIGGAVSGIVVSNWLLAFGFCLFVALAVVKRLDEVTATEHVGAVPGRAYGRGNRQALGVAAWGVGGLSIMTLAAYIAFSVAADIYYRHHGWLWVSAALLAWWLAHVVRCASRGRLRGDPVVFAATDATSLVLAVGVATTLIAAV